MKMKNDMLRGGKLIYSILIGLIIALGLVCVYYESFIAHALHRSEDRVSSRLKHFQSDVLEKDRSIYNETLKTIPVCDNKFSELIPCLDRNLIYQLKLKLNLSLMEHYERKCPPQERRYNCLIPPPIGYKVPIRWPASRDEVWKVNIPHTHLASEKSDQNWMVVNGEKINFPGGGTHFHYGADKYIAAIARMLKFPGEKLNNGGKLRNVLDVGCGVASFGAYLLPHEIIAMSLAPNDVHENQIQFALERGISSTLGVLGTKRLPYPSRSFDLAHCSRCRIDWLQRDGVLLLELDRLLRPGGYFVYSSPEAYAQDPENRRIWAAMSELVQRMCWRIVSKRDQTVIWAKASSNSCYLKRNAVVNPPLCPSDDDPDSVWNVTMQACITPYSKDIHRRGGTGLVPWPQRLIIPPPRLQELDIGSTEYNKNTEVWNLRVNQYWRQMKPVMDHNSFRNIMDMKSGLGGFAAALKDKDVWVMNVVPVQESNKLKIIYDRGLIGTIHDWCESFSTYPRTYDLIHAWTIFFEIQQRGCSIEDLLIEIDRILRPFGFIIVRDKPSIISYIQKLLVALHWDDWFLEIEPNHDALSSGEERVLIARKRLWVNAIKR